MVCKRIHLMFASHNQQYMYGSSVVVNLLGSASGIVLRLRCGELMHESSETRITTLNKRPQKNRRKKLKLYGCFNKCVFISLSVRV